MNSEASQVPQVCGQPLHVRLADIEKRLTALEAAAKPPDAHPDWSGSAMPQPGDTVVVPDLRHFNPDPIQPSTVFTPKPPELPVIPPPVMNGWTPCGYDTDIGLDDDSPVWVIPNIKDPVVTPARWGARKRKFYRDLPDDKCRMDYPPDYWQPREGASK